MVSTRKKRITTEAAGFRWLVRALERAQRRHEKVLRQGGHGFLHLRLMCGLIVQAQRDGLLDVETQVRMKQRIQVEMRTCRFWTKYKHDASPDAHYGPRIIAAQWFALEAAEAGV